MVSPVSPLDPKKLFGEKLRELRLKAHLTQEELAHIADVDRTYVSSCERGRRNLTLEAIVKFATALGAKPSDLLTGIDQGEVDR